MDLSILAADRADRADRAPQALRDGGRRPRPTDECGVASRPPTTPETSGGAA
ncbi:hypothetical protein [Micromonospora sp. DT233]|uniref:hypothetical protein n=1 Tax=Micromonospora sp. DT233 TaxID=3393432 RepID=UPI003CF4D35E